MCGGGVTCVREGLHVWGRGYSSDMRGSIHV